MDAKDLLEALTRGDMRTIGPADEVAPLVVIDPALFQAVIEAMSASDKGLAMRSADVAEKASRLSPGLLQPYKANLLELVSTSAQQEVQWHAIQMIERLELDEGDQELAFQVLERLFNGAQSRIVKASALHAIMHISMQYSNLSGRADGILSEALASPIPSVAARARKLARELDRKTRGEG